MSRITDLTPGKRANLLHIGGERTFRRRLMELGFLPGTPVRLVRNAGIGDLLEIEVRGCFLSLRRSDAAELRIEPLSN